MNKSTQQSKPSPSNTRPQCPPRHQDRPAPPSRAPPRDACGVPHDRPPSPQQAAESSCRERNGPLMTISEILIHIAQADERIATLMTERSRLLVELAAAEGVR